MITNEIIKEDNIREMEYPFGWIPQRFITDGITGAELTSARFMLEKKGFIAYRKPYYQVLKIPGGG